jgi:hypothetical protein
MHAHMKPALKDKLLMQHRAFAAFLLLILGLLPFEGSARLLPALDTSSRNKPRSRAIAGHEPCAASNAPKGRHADIA